MRSIIGLASSLLLVAACSSDDDGSQSHASTTSTSPVPTTMAAGSPPVDESVPPVKTVLAPAGCPVRDESLCGTAIEIVEALVAGNAAALYDLSRVDRIDCVDMNVEYVPGCATADVLEGHGLSDASLIVDIVDDEAYRSWLTAVTTALDPDFADDQGSGAVEVIGIGTCGPDEPGRRTYHVAWTAGLESDENVSERVLGSFELTFVDDWRIALSYVDTLADWEAAQSDPFADAFCEAGRSPWRG